MYSAPSASFVSSEGSLQVRRLQKPRSLSNGTFSVLPYPANSRKLRRKENQCSTPVVARWLPIQSARATQRAFNERTNERTNVGGMKTEEAIPIRSAHLVIYLFVREGGSGSGRLSLGTPLSAPAKVPKRHLETCLEFLSSLRQTHNRSNERNTPQGEEEEQLRW